MGSTLSVIVRIRNSTNSDITAVTVYDFDSFDFGLSRPDKVFKGTSILSQRCTERTIDFSVISSNCPFTTKLVFNDGTEDVFRMNYRCLFEGGETNLRHLTKSHHLNFKKTGPRVLEIVVENSEQQLENKKAEKLISQGAKLMELGQYSEASVKFMEASLKANESKTLLALQQQSQKLKSIQENFELDKRAKSSNNEGLQLLKSCRFYEAVKKFEEAQSFSKNKDTINLIEDNLKIAKDARTNQEAKKLNQEGLLLRKNNRKEAAVPIFDEALRVALDPDLIRMIKNHKSETLNEEAEETLKKAWILEMSSSDEAIHKFAKAKFLFQEADCVKPQPHYQHNIALIDCKIEGEKYYNTAVQKENEASRLIEKMVESRDINNCKKAKDKYEEAWKVYGEARKKFEEGRIKDNRNFERGLELTNQALNGVENILNELEKAVLEIGPSGKM